MDTAASMYRSEQHQFTFKALSVTGGFCSSKIPGTFSEHKGSAGLSGFLETGPGGHRYHCTTDSMDIFFFFLDVEAKHVIDYCFAKNNSLKLAGLTYLRKYIYFCKYINGLIHI